MIVFGREIATPSPRMLAWAGGAVALALLAAGGAWLWWDASQRRVDATYAAVFVRVEPALRPEATPEARAAAVRELEAVLAIHSGGTQAALAASQLGNLRFTAREYAQARAAWELALSRAPRGTLAAGARLGIAASWEAERNFERAAQAYGEALARSSAQDFAFEELLLGLARVQELGGKPEEAKATYKRFLNEAGQSPRADEARARLAALGGA